MDINQEFILRWIDLLWVFPAVVLAHKWHKVFALCFVLLLCLTIRMEIELMHSFGMDGGVTGWVEMGQLLRAQIVISIIIALYLLLAFYSKYTKPIIFMAASLTIYFFTSIFTLFIIAI